MSKKENSDNNKKTQSIEDLLKMDGAGDIKFDQDEAQKELERLEKRKELLESYKAKIKNYDSLSNDDYKMKVLKEMIESGLLMMETMRQELEDNPRGADVEYVSSLMNSINNLIDSISKMDFFKEKIKLEQEKLTQKSREKTLIDGNGNNISNTNVYVSTTSDLLKFIKNGNINSDDIKTIDVIKEI
jgi:hypothetical protein